MRRYKLYAAKGFVLRSSATTIVAGWTSVQAVDIKYNALVSSGSPALMVKSILGRLSTWACTRRQLLASLSLKAASELSPVE